MSVPFIEAAIFPTDISNGSVGGPMFMTFVQGTHSGHEQRIPAWPYARHSYEAQYGVKTPDLGYAVIKFFQAMKGRTYGFKYLDPMDFKSCDLTETVANDDQTLIASAVGGETSAPLVKSYSVGGQETLRPITKPISVLLAKNGTPQTEGVGFTVNYTTGIVSFPALTALDTITVGFQFYVPCRFDIDRLPLSLTGPLISNTRIPILEIRV